MRILFVANGFPPRGQWGTEFYTGQLAAALSARGHAIAALVPDRTASRPRYTLEEAPGEGARLFVLHNAGDPSKRLAASYQDDHVDRVFAAVLDRWQPDVVHFNYLLWGLSLGLVGVAGRRGVPTVATLTDYGLLCHRGQMIDWRIRPCGGPRPAADCARCVRRYSEHDAGALGRFVHRAAGDVAASMGGLGRVATTADLERRAAAARAALDGLDRVIAPTRVLASAFERFGVDPTRIAQIVYAIDEKPYAVARPEPPRPVRFGYLGQLTPHKGVHVLLEAVEHMAGRLPESVEPWSLHVWGAAAGHRHRRYEPSLRARARRGRVVFEPAFASDEAPRVLSGLHAVVVPSLWDENAPLVCLQARAAGVPVIGSRVGGVAEVITHGEHGLLVEPDDPVALADALREVLLGRLGRHPAPGLPMGLAAHVDHIERVYAEARLCAANRRLG